MDFWLDTPGTLHPFYDFLDLNQAIQSRVSRYLHLVQASLEVKLSFLGDDHIPPPLVFAQDDFSML